MLKHNHHFSNLICQLTLIDTKRGWKGGEWTKVLKGSTEVLEFGINCHKIELDLILAAYLKNFQRNFRARGSHEDTSNPERDPCITWMYFHQLSAAISRGLPTHDFKHHSLASCSFVKKAGDAIQALTKWSFLAFTCYHCGVLHTEKQTATLECGVSILTLLDCINVAGLWIAWGGRPFCQLALNRGHWWLSSSPEGHI